MPFDINKQARVASEPNNPGKQSVECLAHFFLEQLRQDKISDEQFIIIDRARFERLKEKNSPVAYDDRPEAVTRSKNKLRSEVDDGKVMIEEVIADFEYLVKKESNISGKSDEKFLRVVNKLGFNLEFYATFRKRALVNWTEKERARARHARLYNQVNPEERSPIESELQAEIKRLQAVHKNELDEPASELLPYMQPKFPNRPALKLYFEGPDNVSNVSFEFPIANPVRAVAAAVPAPMFGLGVGLVDDEDPLLRHNQLIQRREDEKARFRLPKRPVPGAAAAEASAPGELGLAPLSPSAAAAASVGAPDRKYAKDEGDRKYPGDIDSKYAGDLDSKLDADRGYRNCKDEKDYAESTSGASAGEAARSKHKKYPAFAGASSSADPRRDIGEGSVPAADSNPKNYIDNGNIFGSYYNDPKRPQPGEDIQTQRPSFAHSLTVLLGVFGAFLTKIIEVMMGFSDLFSGKSKNANPHRELDSQELQVANADLFDEYRKKITDEAARNKLVEDWRAATTAEARDQVMETLKDKLASSIDVDLSEDLQTLNFKLCLRKLEGVEFDVPGTVNIGSAGVAATKIKLDNQEKTYLSRLWRGGWRKQALERLHGFMAKAGLYIQMDESLRDLEYATKDKGLLVTLEMKQARELYGKMLADIHGVDLREASEIDPKFPALCYKVRQELLDEIAKAELQVSNTITNNKALQSVHSKFAEAEKKLLAENPEKVSKDVADEYQRSSALVKQAKDTEQKMRSDIAKALEINLAHIASLNHYKTTATHVLERIKVERAKAAAQHQFAKRLSAAERDFEPKRTLSAAAANAAVAAPFPAAGSFGAAGVSGRTSAALDALRRDDMGGSGLASSVGSRLS